MLKPQLAIADFKRVIALDPHNQTVKAQLEATQKLVRKIEFEKVCMSTINVLRSASFSAYWHMLMLQADSCRRSKFKRKSMRCKDAWK
jgi:hypothetical protein